MNSSGTSIRHFVTRLFAGILVVAALALSALRFYLLPEIAEHRAELEQRIGHLIDETVEIGSVSARMRGVHPELLLREFRIVDQGGGPGIHFDRVVVGIDLPRTLLSGQLAPREVVIFGTHLSVRRQSNGSIVVLGLNVIDHPPYWLIRANRIDLLDSTLDWQDELRHGPLVELGKADLHLANDASRHLLSLNAGPENPVSASLSVRADLHGDLFRAGDWGGRIYVQSDAMEADRLRGLLPMATGTKAGRYGFRVWSDWNQGNLARLAGKLTAHHPAWEVSDDSGRRGLLRFAELESWFRWRASGANSVMEFDGLRWATVAGSKSLPARLAVAREADESGRVHAWRIMGNRLQIGDIVSALAVLLPFNSEPAREAVRGASVQGVLRDFALVYRPGEEVGPRLLACADFYGLGIEPSATVPGIARLRGRICGTERKGSLRLSSGKTDLALPRVMHIPIRLDRFGLGLVWHQHSGDLRLAFDEFAFSGTDFAVRGEGAVRWLLGSGSAPIADVRLEVGNLAVDALERYLPSVAYPAWSDGLREILLGGRIADGRIQIRGMLGDRGATSFWESVEAELPFQKLGIRYHPEWPPLQDVDGTLRLMRGQLAFDADRGSLGRGEVRSLGARITDLSKTPVLKLQGSVTASLSEVMDFLAHTPQRALTDGLAKWGELRGSADIALDLDTPLESAADRMRVKGFAKLKDLGTGDQRVPKFLGPLTGSLSFSEVGLTECRLAGTLFNDQLSVVLTPTESGLELNARSRIRVNSLADAMPSPYWRAFSGDAHIEFSALIPRTKPPAPQPVPWSLTSNLKGLGLDLPEPVGKSADAVRDLVISGELGAGQPFGAKVAYDTRLKADLAGSVTMSGVAVERAVVSWERAAPHRALGQGLRFFGRFTRLDLAAWSDYLSAMPGVGARSSLGWQEAELEVREAVWRGHDVGSLKVEATRQASGWKGTLDGDLAAGRFEWIGKEPTVSQLVLDLERAAVPASRKDSAGVQAPADGGSPRAWPAIRASARKLFWRGVEVGGVQLEAHKLPQGLRFDRVELTGGHHRLAVAGDWTDASGAPKVSIEGLASADNLGELAGRLGAGKIKDTRTSVAFKLAWPGVPWALSRAKLDGTLRVEMSQGTLLDVDPGWGRVIGFLNISSIWRRINLDFRDLFSQGFAYDGVKGEWHIASGTASTKGFVIEGMAARILVDGEADLAAGTLDQIVTVVPRTSVALPIAGTLAGGPAVGAAVLVAQELVGDHVDNITATRYHVTGPWESPHFERVEGNMPMELLGRAWSGLKGLSGREREQEKTRR